MVIKCNQLLIQDKEGCKILRKILQLAKAWNILTLSWSKTKIADTIRIFIAMNLLLSNCRPDLTRSVLGLRQKIQVYYLDLRF